MPHPCAVIFVFCLVALAPGASLAQSPDWRGIDWVEGFEAGLAQARQAQRPAFVYFDALWCTWCHQYKAETLSKEDVQRYINGHYVPVLVDYDARPDLLRRYGGRGLPFTVVFTPDGELIKTFVGILSPQDLIATLETLRDARAAKRAAAHAVLAEVMAPSRAQWRAFRQAYLNDHLDRLYDPNLGVLAGRFETGATLKRPAPLTWMMLADQPGWSDRARRATRVQRDNLLDPVDGGFFNFLDPHGPEPYLETSKLLESNAWLSAWQLSMGDGQPAAHRAGLSGLYFLQETLWDRDDGGFWQAQRADPDYYATMGRERLQARPPGLDRLKRTDTNAQTAWALACMGERLAGSGPSALAADTLDAVFELLWRDGTLYHIRRSGEAQVANLPEDIFWLLAAGTAVAKQRPDAQRRERLRQVAGLAAQWIEAQRRREQPAVPVEIAGLAAWAGLHRELYPRLPAGTWAWAIEQLRIEAETPPDELIPGLVAWEVGLDVRANEPRRSRALPVCPFQRSS